MHGIWSITNIFSVRIRYNLLFYDRMIYKICISQNTSVFRQESLCAKEKVHKLC